MCIRVSDEQMVTSVGVIDDFPGEFKKYICREQWQMNYQSDHVGESHFYRLKNRDLSPIMLVSSTVTGINALFSISWMDELVSKWTWFGLYISFEP